MAAKFFGSRNAVLWLSIALMSSCGGGGASPPPPPVTTPPPPTVNTAPSVDVGDDQNAKTGQLVTLEGIGTDPENNTLTYEWEQIGGPTVIGYEGVAHKFEFVTSFTGASETYTFELAVKDTGGLTATDTVKVSASSNVVSCTPTAPPEDMGFDPFYRWYCDANGIPVLSSENAPSRAVKVAALQIRKMTSMRADILVNMLKNGAQFVIIANEEVLTDIPEYAHLKNAPPPDANRSWDSLRGLGGTKGQPVGSTSEENLLCYNSNEAPGLNILIHEAAHSMENLGMEEVDRTWNSRVTSAFETAINSGLWEGMYASTNIDEYFAEGFGIFYNTGQAYEAKLDMDMNTRDKLLNYDSSLYNLVAEMAPELNIETCP